MSHAASICGKSDASDGWLPMASFFKSMFQNVRASMLIWSDACCATITINAKYLSTPKSEREEKERRAIVLSALGGGTNKQRRARARVLVVVGRDLGVGELEVLLPQQRQELE